MSGTCGISSCNDRSKEQYAGMRRDGVLVARFDSVVVVLEWVLPENFSF